MPRSGLGELVVRFLFGVLAAVATGMLVYGRYVFDPTTLAFQCLTVGTLSAAIFALLRSHRPTSAVGLTVVFALAQLGLADASGWAVALSGALLAGGVLLVGAIFHLFAERGFLFGKFLLAGPLLGGVFLAIAPLAEFHRMTWMFAATSLMRYVFLGLLIGDGVGLGIEIADLVVLGWSRAKREAGPAH